MVSERRRKLSSENVWELLTAAETVAGRHVVRSREREGGDLSKRGGAARLTACCVAGALEVRSPAVWGKWWD